jgi:hypothetical protein
MSPLFIQVRGVLILRSSQYEVLRSCASPSSSPPLFIQPLQHLRHEMLYASASDRRRVDMVKNVSALDAYREGEIPLPPGYTIEHGADVLLVRREGGTVVAAFSARGATVKEVKRTAWDDHKRSTNTA